MSTINNEHIQMEWTTEKNTDNTQTVYYSHCKNNNEAAIKHAVNQTLEKAISYLYDNIQDDSLYFLVEWNNDDQSLAVVVTDDSKQKESKHKVHCDFSEIGNSKVVDENTPSPIDVSSIQYWARDLLTTDTQYIRFSLVAIFSQGDRQKTQLL
ncbi:hypothetical protein ACVBE9_03895 [Eionea flava]